jgi:hypothetical protein
VPSLLQLSDRERSRLARIENAIAEMPRAKEELIEEMEESYGHLFDFSSYTLKQKAASRTGRVTLQQRV